MILLFNLKLLQRNVTTLASSSNGVTIKSNNNNGMTAKINNNNGKITVINRIGTIISNKSSIIGSSRSNSQASTIRAMTMGSLSKSIIKITTKHNKIQVIITIIMTHSSSIVKTRENTLTSSTMIIITIIINNLLLSQKKWRKRNLVMRNL